MSTRKIPLPEIIAFFIVALVAILMFLPFLLTISTSLKTMAEVESPEFRLIPESFQWQNYADAMASGNWSRYFMNSLLITSITVCLSLIFNSLAGFSFARFTFPGRGVLFYLILIGLMVPEQVTLIPLFKMMSNFPLFGGNNILGQGGTGLINSRLGLIIPYLAAPFGIFLCRQFYLGFPKAIDDAASIDGASKWRLYAQIYIPSSGPVLAALGVLKTTHTWNNYLWPLILINSDEMYTVQLGLTKFRTAYGVEWNLLMAATILVVLPLLVIFLLAQKHFVSGVVTSGVKG
ncbi:MAG: carbohydrate ABC transporter permease [Spirochaetales bacterium]|nr:carbohydrate ABC transporter permease [Spirochaetales bacterium]